mmetsp:Transcript_11689/g.16423  ORF Transcript_11689/g.16423 Transcript_11689/m.16423 type:complete len:317 (-) Transcript_11689:84-1034(-)
MLSLELNNHAEISKKVGSDLTITGLISHSRFPIYQAFSKSSNKYFALKFFPVVEGESESDIYHQQFVKETQIAGLNHPNIINIVEKVEKQKVICEDTPSMNSIMYMEFAPFPDFASLSKDIEFGADPKMSRTYFAQLINAMQYLHKNGIAHMDIKPENMVLSHEFQLKLIDFEFSMLTESKVTDEKSLDKGTPHFRAPEVRSQKVSDFAAADVYAAGITLFALHCGVMPYLEDTKFDEFDMYDLLQNDTETFWAIHQEIVSPNVKMSDSFKALFESMTREDPAKRATLEEIKKSEWMNEQTMTDDELYKYMSDMFY